MSKTNSVAPGSLNESKCSKPASMTLLTFFCITALVSSNLAFGAGAPTCILATDSHDVRGAPDDLDELARDVSAQYREEIDNLRLTHDLRGEGNVAVAILSKDGEPIEIFVAKSKKTQTVGYQAGINGESIRLDFVSRQEQAGKTYHSEGDLVERIFAEQTRLGERNFYRTYDRITLYSEKVYCSSCSGILRNTKRTLLDAWEFQRASDSTIDPFRFSATWEYRTDGPYVAHQRWNWEIPGEPAD